MTSRPGRGRGSARIALWHPTLTDRSVPFRTRWRGVKDIVAVHRLSARGSEQPQPAGAEIGRGAFVGWRAGRVGLLHAGVEAVRWIDASGSIVMPGGIDPHIALGGP